MLVYLSVSYIFEHPDSLSVLHFRFAALFGALDIVSLVIRKELLRLEQMTDCTLSTTPDIEKVAPGSHAVVVMAKAPIRGAVKSRLVPPLTDDEAAALNRCFI